MLVDAAAVHVVGAVVDVITVWHLIFIFGCLILFSRIAPAATPENTAVSHLCGIMVAMMFW